MPKDPAKARRTASACVACRQSKIKCSGEEPCANCQRRFVHCRFADNQKNVVVSRQYLDDLRKRAENTSAHGGYPPAPAAQGQARTTHTAPSNISPPDSSAVPEPRHGSPDRALFHQAPSGPSLTTPVESELVAAGDNGHVSMTVWTNPFSFPSKTIRNPDKNSRRWIWLAPSSTWSFTVRLTLMLMEGLQYDDTEMASASETGTIYPMSWKPTPEDEAPDIRGLPSVDHAIYLFNTAKFHLCQQYSFFTEGSFEGQIRQFYHGDTRVKASTSRLWLTQFLVVLAFGTAFLSKAQNPSEAPGSKYFVRAMSLMPPMASMWKEALLASETLALVALYFYSTNHRESALLYVGQALRIAQLEGIHTQLPEAQLGRATVQRCRNLWLTLWILDQHISTSLGLSMSTADCEYSSITGQSTTGMDEDTVLSLQAKLSHLNWDILSTLYKDDRSPIGVFLERTRSILQTLAGHAQEIEQIIALKFGNSMDTMPKGTRHITLLYHQCVIVATRPLLLSVLKERLDRLNEGNERPDHFENFLALTATLISTGIKSATKILHILSREEPLLASFLPFDLEFTHSAGLHLIMAQTLFPGEEEDANHVQQARDILEEMITKGSKVAELRRIDLARLEKLCAELTAKSQQLGMQTLILPVKESSITDTDREGTGQSQHDGSGSGSRIAVTALPSEQIMPDFSEYSPETALRHQHVMENNMFMDDIGISSDAFFMIADQMAEMGAMEFSMPNVSGFMIGGPHVLQ